MTAMPSLFVGHGSPMLALHHNDYTEAIRLLGQELGKPKAIVVFSAHWVSRELSITSSSEVYETIHDFGGFPRELFEMEYPAKGSEAVAEQVRTAFEKQGIPVAVNGTRGLDHGSWVILSHLYKDADVPVVSVSVNPLLPPQEQYRIGAALSGLKEDGILIIGSGGTVHNFYEMSPAPTPVPWAAEFDDWLIDKMHGWDTESLFQYLELAPHARKATPDYEHFLPFMIALGTGDRARKGTVLHQSYDMGTLSQLLIRFE